MGAFFWAIVAAGIWGLVPILEKIGLSQVQPLVGLFYRCLGVFVGLIILPIFFLKGQQIRSVDLKSVMLLALGGFLASFVAQIAFYRALKTGEVSRVVPISGSYPFLAFLLGVMLLGESISFGKLTGVVLVIVGIWLLKIS